LIQFTGNEQPADGFSGLFVSLLCRRMCGRMNALQCSDCHLSVDLGCFNVGVAEHLLNAADVGSVFVHQCCHRVTKQMARTALAQFRSGDVAPRDVRQVVPAERTTVTAQECRVAF
jgi:hypothetical protein